MRRMLGTAYAGSNDGLQLVPVIPPHPYALLHSLSISEIPTGSFVLTSTLDEIKLTWPSVRTYLLVVIHPFTIIELDLSERRSRFAAYAFPDTLENSE